MVAGGNWRSGGVGFGFGLRFRIGSGHGGGTGLEKRSEKRFVVKMIIKGRCEISKKKLTDEFERGGFLIGSHVEMLS